jgi:hypothetical protein
VIVVLFSDCFFIASTPISAVGHHCPLSSEGMLKLVALQ